MIPTTHFDAAASDLGAALLLAGEQPALSSSLLSQAQDVMMDFNTMAIASKPIGFYTWSTELSRIFQQDRLLQNYQGEPWPYNTEEFGKAAVLALTIDSVTSLSERYEGYLALYAGLTNPFMNYPVTALIPYLNGTASLAELDRVKEQFLNDYPPPELLP